MTVNKNEVYADRDSRRNGREVKVLHVGDGYATVQVISNSFNAVKSSIGKTTDIRVDRLTKEYTYVGTPEDESQPELQPIVGFEGDSKVVGGFENSGLSEEYKANLVAQYGETDLATWDKSPEDEEFIKDEVDLEDALSMAGYYWLPPEDSLVEAILEVTSEVELNQESLIRMVHQTIRGLRVS